MAASVRIVNDHEILNSTCKVLNIFSHTDLKKLATVLNAEYIVGGVGSTLAEEKAS